MFCTGSPLPVSYAEAGSNVKASPIVTSVNVVGSLDFIPLVAGASVAPGASVAAGASVEGASVAAGGCAWVAGAAPPQAAKIMLAMTNKLNKANDFRIFFFSSQRLKVYRQR